MERRPNIIIFNPDQMRADSLGHLGNPTGITPFLDSFAMEEGVSFRNAFCQNPVCVPSRCSFTSGLYPHVHGHRTMGHLLHEHETSLFEELKHAGYHVWMNARNDLVAGQVPGLVERHATEIFYGGASVNAPGPEGDLTGGPGHPNYYSMHTGKLPVGEDGKRFGPDDEDLAGAIERIRHMPKDKPLCLFLALINPHPPYQVEEPYYSAVDSAKIPPRILPEDTVGRPRMEELLRQNQKLEKYTEEEWTRLRATYLGMCRKVDDMFRQLCQALKDAGEYDNSAIFFLSDHGDYTGDYGISEKCQNSFPDCLTRVPLLVKPPKGAGVDPGIAEGMVELVDFYATAMDYAGVEPDHSHFGRTLRDMVADRGVEGRPFVCCEGGRLPEEIHCDESHKGREGGFVHPANPYWPRMMAQQDGAAHAKGFMLRTKDYKYISRVSDEDEFYDLQKDPQEKINQIHNPEYGEKVIGHQQMLMKWLMRTTDVVPFQPDQRFSEEMSWNKVRYIVPPEYEQEIREKIRQGTDHFMLLNECRARFGKK